MKVILTEEQYDKVKYKIYDKFIDMLVRDTEIFGFMKYDYNKYSYAAHMKFPYTDNFYNLAFNNPNEFTFTSPARYNLKSFFMLVGVDMDEEPKKAENLWNEYLDKLEVKVKKSIKKFLDDEN